MFLYFQLMTFFLFSMAVLLLIKKKWLRIIIAVIFNFFLGLQCVSVYMGDSVIDLKFYAHFNYHDVTLLGSAFIGESIFFSFCVLFMILFQLKFASKMEGKIKWFFTVPVILLSTALFSFTKNGMYYEIYDLVRMYYVEAKTFSVALDDLGMSSEDYVYPSDAEGTPGKNIIVISLESLENGYLQEDMREVCPNLAKLRDEENYYVMNQGPGSNWTAASLYTYFTGFPMYFKAYGNSIFQTSIGTQIPGISHVLNSAGYEQFYLMGDNSHAGINDFLKTYEVPYYEQAYYTEKYGETGNGWGLHDYDLFKEAKEKVSELSGTGKPFALYMSTVSTHYPDGVYDERMKDHVTKKDSELEFMAAAVDWMIADFLDYLEENNLMDNTVFYIFPDHLLMGQGSSVLNKFNARELYMITNASEKSLDRSNDDRIDQIELPKLILRGAGVEHNLQLMTDIITGNKMEFIEDHKDDILTLNEASLKRVNNYEEEEEEGE